MAKSTPPSPPRIGFNSQSDSDIICAVPLKITTICEKVNVQQYRLVDSNELK